MGLTYANVKLSQAPAIKLDCWLKTFLKEGSNSANKSRNAKPFLENDSGN